MNKTFVIRNGSVLLPNGTISKLDIRITNGTIDSVGSDLKADEIIDAEGSYVLPGLIDIHTHGSSSGGRTRGEYLLPHPLCPTGADCESTREA